MRIISHRGNIRGRVPGRENAPSYIDCALGNGYDVEMMCGLSMVSFG